MDLSKETIAKLKGLIVFTVVIVILGVNYPKVIGAIGVGIGIISPFLTGAAIGFLF